MRSKDLLPADFSSPAAIAKPLAYYRKHYAGWTRGDLIARVPTLYQRLRRKGLLVRIPTRHPPFGGDPLQYYRRHYAGVTRVPLRLQDPGLHRCLEREGLLGKIPVKPRNQFR